MNKINLRFFYILHFTFYILLSPAFAQNHNKDLVQFSGVVVTGDSLKPIPFTSIIIKGTFRGTVSDYYGFFSFVAKKTDTIEFSCLGFKKAHYIIPDTLTENKYSLIQMMNNDTIFLKETVIYPWPTQEQFKEAFLRLNIPDDDLERARRNLARAEIKEKYQKLSMDGSMNYKNAMQQKTSQLYYAGQAPPNNLLNPIAWSKFIQAWQNGDFKKKE